MSDQTFFEIPLTPNAQRFLITLAGVQYSMSIAWRTAVGGGWFIDIADANDVPIVQGIPFVTGADLLAQYPDKNFGGSLYIFTDGDGFAVPTYDNLGKQSHLYFSLPTP